MRILCSFLLLFCCLLPAAFAAEETCSMGDCLKCHTLSVEQAAATLGNLVDKVNSVNPSEVPGMWAVEVEKSSQKFPIFLDYSKKYLFSGNVIRIADMKNVTQQLAASMNKVDVSQIPLDDALLLGDPAAKTKVILFTDPQCPYCKKMHATIQEVVKRDPQIAFLIKLYPLKIHPKAYDISKSVVCANSLELLEKSFRDEQIPPPTCDTKVIDENLALAQKIGIRSTPSMILPNGEVHPGAKSVDEILRLLGSSK